MNDKQKPDGWVCVMRAFNATVLRGDEFGEWQFANGGSSEANGSDQYLDLEELTTADAIDGLMEFKPIKIKRR